MKYNVNDSLSDRNLFLIVNKDKEAINLTYNLKKKVKSQIKYVFCYNKN